LLDLAYNSIGPLGVGRIACALNENLTMTEVSLTGNTMGDDDVKRLNNLLTERQLRADIARVRVMEGKQFHFS